MPRYISRLSAAESKATRADCQLWMGTHPTLPSRLDPSITLSQALSSDPALIGSSVAKAFPDTKDGSLPFLFKVLSIGTALSIQAHPDKPLAERLFKERPDVYKGAPITV
jgi:mannose-6-phosphate isomerase